MTLVLVASLVLPGCAGKTNAQEVLLGALVARTGDLASSGESIEAALELAVQDINEYLSGIASQISLKLIVEDTGTDPAAALKKLKGLAAKGVKLVIGPQSSAELEAVKAFADEKGILLISADSTAPSLAIAGDNVFRFALGDSLQAEAVADLMWKDGIRAVVPMHRGDVWGDDLAGAIKSRFEQRGGAILEGSRYSPATTDFSVELSFLSNMVSQAISGYGAGAVAVSLLSFEEAAAIFVQAQTDPILSSVGWYGSDGIALSQVLTGNTSAALFAIKVGLVSPVYGGNAEQQAVIEQRIQIKTGRQPEAFALAAYDAVWVAALTCVTTSASNDPAILKKALLQTANFYAGVTGNTSLDDAGDRKFGDLAFWALKEEKGTFQWKQVARWMVVPGWQGWDSSITESAFPSRPVTIITGWLGGSEQFLNTIAPEASKALGVPVNIVNRVGNNGMEAVRAFESVPADGYTLLLILDFDAARFAQGKMAINPAEDWAPILIGNLAITQIYIRSDDPRYSTWDELTAYAREHTGLKLATIADPLSLEGLSATSLEQAFGIIFEPVPFESAPQRNASFLTGETDLLIDQPGDVKQYIDAGQYKPVLTLWNERARGFEDVPTAKEKGAGFTPLLRLRGLVAPGGTPPDVIEALRTALQAAFNSATFQQYLKENALDLTPYPVDPAATIREQVELYKP